MVDFIGIKKKGDLSRETSTPEAQFILLTDRMLIHNGEHASLHHKTKKNIYNNKIKCSHTAIQIYTLTLTELDLHSNANVATLKHTYLKIY